MIDAKTGIWDLETANSHGGHKHDEGIIKRILEEYEEPAMLADLGCGDGWYCTQLKEKWKNSVIHGYEGCADMKTEGVYDDIFIIDLSLKRYTDIKYDLVLCIEVGEHIPLEKEQVFLDNVREFCSNQLIMSWALPKQGGRGHFNERPEEYIYEEMSKRGFIVKEDLTKSLRDSATLKWLKRTVTAYEL
jgi:hypothetical protein